jgi:F-type H+-transporting ATPase subunit epsilon
MITALGRGTLSVQNAGSVRQFDVDGGFLQVVDNQVRVVTEHAEQHR